MMERVKARVLEHIAPPPRSTATGGETPRSTGE
jgi:hypothetical protein